MTVDTLYDFHSIRSSDFCIVASKVAVVVLLSDITNDRGKFTKNSSTAITRNSELEKRPEV